MDRYSDLIDMALDKRDEKWFNNLIKLRKEKIKLEPVVIEFKNIALEDLDNKSCVIKAEEGVRKALSLEELERYEIVIAKSKRQDALRILKNEEVVLEDVSIENQYIYKLMYQQYLKGAIDTQNLYTPYLDEALRLRNQIDALIANDNMLLIQLSKSLDEAKTNNDINSKSKFNLKNLFKKIKGGK